MTSLPLLRYLLASTLLISGSVSALTNPSTLSTADKQAMLDYSNTVRSEAALGVQPAFGGGTHPYASNMNQLIWDPALAKVASDYAANCDFSHNPNRNTDVDASIGLASFASPRSQAIGENIYVSSVFPAQMNVEFQGTNYGVMGGLIGWAEENDDWSFESAYSGACPGSQCGHYTQMVWAKTRYIGCGYASCSGAIANTSFSEGTMVVCNYYPAGNYSGQAIYLDSNNATDVTSACEADRTADSNTGLCAGGVDASFSNDGGTTVDTCDDGLGRSLCSTPAADYDNDGAADNIDSDDDNDGVNDASDQCPQGTIGTGTAPINADNDGDGCDDQTEDLDDDNDGIPDTQDANPNTADGPGDSGASPSPPKAKGGNSSILLLLLLALPMGLRRKLSVIQRR